MGNMQTDNDLKPKITKIYRLERDIDGYGGKMPDKYFFDFNQAKSELLNSDPISFDSEKGYTIFGMKGCVSYDHNEFLSLTGVPYPDDEKNDWSINRCSVKISPIEIPFEIKDKTIYLLKFNSGYKFLESFNSTPVVNILNYCRSEKAARKIAARNKHLKKIARSWVRREDQERISALGNGEDYLSIQEVQIN